MILAFFRQWFINIADVFASEEFSEIESRRRAAQDMRNLRWRRYENRWVDGF